MAIDDDLRQPEHEWMWLKMPDVKPVTPKPPWSVEAVSLVFAAVSLVSAVVSLASLVTIAVTR